MQRSQILEIPALLHLLGEIAYGRRDHSDHRGGEGDLHVVGHRPDVSGGESHQCRAHGNQGAHEAEHGAELGKVSRPGHVLVGVDLEFGEQFVLQWPVGACVKEPTGVDDHRGGVLLGKPLPEGLEAGGAEALYLVVNELVCPAHADILAEEAAYEQQGLDEQQYQQNYVRHQQSVRNPEQHI